MVGYKLWVTVYERNVPSEQVVVFIVPISILVVVVIVVIAIIAIIVVVVVSGGVMRCRLN